MVEETSEASKDQQSEKVLPVKTTRARARVAKSAASENNTCMSTCRIRNLISTEKATSQPEKRSCYVIKAMDNV